MNFEELSKIYDEYLKGEIVQINKNSIWMMCDDWDDLNSESIARRCIQLVFTDLIEMRCRTGKCESMKKSSGHHLLWNHNDPLEKVYFTDLETSPYEVIGRLYELHRATFGNWREFHDYWVASPKTLAGGFGLLFTGPSPLADAYCSALEGLLRYSRVVEHSPKEQYSAFIFDRNFVVARGALVYDRTDHPCVTGNN